ncbi:hypothetical protein MD484_g8636, partial [Candolleomyces efflorescens]
MGHANVGSPLLKMQEALSALRPIFTLLLDASDQLETLTTAVRLPSPLLNGPLLSKKKFPKICQININLEMGAIKDDQGNLLSMGHISIQSCSGTLWDSPSLKVINVETMPIIADLDSILPSWANLTSLGTLMITQSQMRKILRLCRSLVHGSFQCHERDRPLYSRPQSRSQLVALPKLRSLTLINFDALSLNSVFRFFEDIALESLSIKNRLCTHTTQSNCTTKVYDIVSKSGSTLKELVLDHICLNPQRFQVYLEALPNLTSLTLEYGSNPSQDAAMQRLIIPTDLSFNEILVRMTPSLYGDPTESAYEDIEKAVTLTPKLRTFVLNVPGDNLYEAGRVNQAIAANVMISRTMPHAEVNKVAPLENFTIAGTALVPGPCTWSGATPSLW